MAENNTKDRFVKAPNPRGQRGAANSDSVFFTGFNPSIDEPTGGRNSMAYRHWVVNKDKKVMAELLRQSNCKGFSWIDYPAR
ncbi:hypothetical protein [Pseudomonas sp. NFX98]|uniref:hypothetical protein n=1 Tax=Pseudomonas sp. NFX98 TaxID=3399122 RepID=UPI0039FCD0D9